MKGKLGTVVLAGLLAFATFQFVLPLALPPVARADSLQEIVLESKAKKSGDPDDAMDVAKYHDKQKGKNADKQAMEWYGKAAAGYLKKGKEDKAEKALEAMKKIDPKHKDVAKLEAMLAEKNKGGKDDKGKAPEPPAKGAPPVAAAPAGKPEDLMAAGVKAWRDGKFDKARPLLEPAANAGRADAQYALGSAIYADLKGIRTKQTQWSDAAAGEWFRKAAKQGHMGARFILSMLYLPEADFGEASRYEQEFLKAKADPWYGEIQERAALKHVDAMRALSKAYRLGHGEQQNWDTAEAYAAAAGSMGDPEGTMDAFAIAMAPPDVRNAEYRSVESNIQSSTSWTPRNRASADKHLRDAAEMGVHRARVLRAFLFYRGMEGGEDHAASFEEYRKLAVDGDEQTIRYLERVGKDIFPTNDPGAKYAIGAIYVKMKNAAEAEKWMTAGGLGYAQHSADLPLACKVKQALMDAKLPAGSVKAVEQAVAKGNDGGGCAKVKPIAAAPPAAAPPAVGAPKPPVAAPVVAGKPLADGLKLLDAKNFAAARPILLAHAEAGNHEAMVAMGHLLYDDLAQTRTVKNQWDALPALEWFRKATAAGDLEAGYIVSTLTVNLRSVNLNEVEDGEKHAAADTSKSWRKALEAQAKAGHLAAQRALAKAYRKGHGGPRDDTAFFTQSTQTAAAGDPFAAMDLAWGYLSPADGEVGGKLEVMFPAMSGKTWKSRDAAKAKEVLDKAGAAGYLEADLMLGFFQHKGLFWGKDLADSLKHYRRLAPTARAQEAKFLGQVAAGEHDPGAAFALGDAQLKGTPEVPANKKESIGRYKEASLAYVQAKEEKLACEGYKALAAAGGAKSAEAQEVQSAAKGAFGKPCPDK